ncbi:glycosyltransferase family 2 protein [Helicobacter sp.]|uniref:glycosyltransferase family 2 protein n=1 Tax=Helicobacter sp. TaxID=218 RepID=UPI002A74BDBD|nr:glycosyltransferase family 2 protein [Helicobacter sp.]MDY2584234.1 glycosyltransferase family 2 protein [Helicobacter sp.]
MYNISTKYLKECVDSVLNQTNQNFEILLVDNGSTDLACKEMAKDYVCSDSRITLLHKRINEGATTGRELVISYFKGEIQAKHTKKENELSIFEITTENIYNIDFIHKNTEEKSLAKPDADYITFLDSDDV